MYTSVMEPVIFKAGDFLGDPALPFKYGNPAGICQVLL